MCQRHTKSAPPAIFHVAGSNNTLADVPSRIVPSLITSYGWYNNDPGRMCPPEFLTLFDNKSPLPQKRLWTNVQPPFRPLVERDINASWAAIAIATVDHQARASAWTNWCSYARKC
jgi:hypothetical protein